MNYKDLLYYIESITLADSSYKEPKESKLHENISCFSNGSCFYSQYNASQDALRFSELIDFNKSGFIIIGGLGNAYHIYPLLEKCSDSFFIILEDTYSSFKSLFLQNNFSKLSHYKNLDFCSINDLQENIVSLYSPALFGNLLFKSPRSWTSYHSNLIPVIKKNINNALQKVSCDYSVQCHFGKIWMRNILKNIETLEKKYSHFVNPSSLNVPINKTVAIIAAGPSLDDSIDLLIQNRNDFFIIATDTALKILHNYSIVPDVWITIDGQNISSRLFMGLEYMNIRPSLAVIDLSAHPNAVLFSIQNNIPILFCSTGHPLSQFFENKTDVITNLASGSGTVTITAVDIAVKLRFKTIVLFGADFSYSKNKPYAKGTYLESFFSTISNRITNTEYNNINLMFRTEVYKKGACYTSPVLNSYKQSLVEYIQKVSTTQDVDFFSSEMIYNPLNLREYTNSKHQNNRVVLKCTMINKPLSNLKQKYLAHIQKNNATSIDKTLLPYYAWYLTKNKLSPSKTFFFSFKSLVKKQFAIYTIIHHES